MKRSSLDKQFAKEWRAFLKNADDKMKQAVADALNEASDEVVKKIKSNMDKQGIKVRTGKLKGSLEATKATKSAPNVVIKSEVYAPLPKNVRRWRSQLSSLDKKDRHWKRLKSSNLNPMKPKMKYPAQGVPYGRIIEFSPRINKPFFYTAWYETRRAVKARMLAKITKTWSDL